MSVPVRNACQVNPTPKPYSRPMGIGWSVSATATTAPNTNVTKRSRGDRVRCSRLRLRGSISPTQPVASTTPQAGPNAASRSQDAQLLPVGPQSASSALSRQVKAFTHNFRQSHFIRVRVAVPGAIPSSTIAPPNPALQRSGWISAILRCKCSKNAFPIYQRDTSSRPLNAQPLGRIVAILSHLAYS
jgi:hypothetical protein